MKKWIKSWFYYYSPRELAAFAFAVIILPILFIAGLFGLDANNTVVAEARHQGTVTHLIPHNSESPMTSRRVQITLENGVSAQVSVPLNSTIRTGDTLSVLEQEMRSGRRNFSASEVIISMPIENSTYPDLSQKPLGGSR